MPMLANLPSAATMVTAAPHCVEGTSAGGSQVEAPARCYRNVSAGLRINLPDQNATLQPTSAARGRLRRAPLPQPVALPSPRTVSTRHCRRDSANGKWKRRFFGHPAPLGLPLSSEVQERST
jgi:hypothetical protein